MVHKLEKMRQPVFIVGMPRSGTSLIEQILDSHAEVFGAGELKDFTDAFIKLSRDVHFLNDDRAKIKLEINNHTGSKIKEIKEYTRY